MKGAIISMFDHTKVHTLGELKAAGWKDLSIKDEMRNNLLAKLRAGETIFPGIIGYDKTVVPQVIQAVLAKHDFLLLGLRGQAKTRMIRQLVNLLDDTMPIIEGSPIHESPYRPLTRQSRELAAVKGEDMPIEWVPRERRYNEKLATPDVSIADLIGDVDPIKAVSRKLDLSDEEVIHFGIIPRSNRGIFAINELPDLQSRIQVGLLNILEEKDIQIRGFPVRLPLDLSLVFTANPEDYTNRGNIITPLKDRIDAQIITHYPETLEDAVHITSQEAWVDRGSDVLVAPLMTELVEHVAMEARRSDYVDSASGVSARMSISFLETICSAAEMRAAMHHENQGVVRVNDLFASLPAMTGKIELVYKGEQEGISNVAIHLIGRAIKEAFNSRFVKNYKRGRDKNPDLDQFQPIVNWFENGNVLDIDTNVSQKDFEKTLGQIDDLEKLAKELGQPKSDHEKWLFAEFIVEGLHQNFLLTKRIQDARIRYTDAVAYMMDELKE